MTRVSFLERQAQQVALRTARGRKEVHGGIARAQSWVQLSAWPSLPKSPQHAHISNRGPRLWVFLRPVRERLPTCESVNTYLRAYPECLCRLATTGALYRHAFNHRIDVSSAEKLVIYIRPSAFFVKVLDRLGRVFGF